MHPTVQLIKDKKWLVSIKLMINHRTRLLDWVRGCDRSLTKREKSICGDLQSYLEFAASKTREDKIALQEMGRVVNILLSRAFPELGKVFNGSFFRFFFSEICPNWSRIKLYFTHTQ